MMNKVYFSVYITFDLQMGHCKAVKSAGSHCLKTIGTKKISG